MIAKCLIFLSLLCVLTQAQWMNPSTPLVFWASEPVQPGDTVLVSGIGFGSNNTGSYLNAGRVDDNSGQVNYQSISLIQCNDQSFKWIVPTNWAEGVYAFQLTNPGFSGSSQNTEVVYINAPNVWWTQGDFGLDSASQGGWLRILGTGLLFSSAPNQPSLTISGNGNSVNINPNNDQTNSPYSLMFAIPSSLSTGTYQMTLSNGYGDVQVQLDQQLNVQAPYNWNTRVYDVTQQSGNSDDARASNAVAQIMSNGGGVLYFPAGTYTISSGWTLPANAIIKGDGQSSSIINFNFGSPPWSMINTYGSFGIEDITLNMPGGSGYTIGFFSGGDGIWFCNNAAIVAPSGSSFYDLVSINGFNGVADIDGCTFSNAARMIWQNPNGGRYANSVFSGAGSPFLLEQFVPAIVEGCTFSEPDQYFMILGAGKYQYFANNQVASTYGNDGVGGVYVGTLSSVSNNGMTLTANHNPTYDQTKQGDAFFASGLMVAIILDGTGAGQKRILTGNPNNNDFTIESPFDAIGSDSTVAITFYRGDVIVYNNVFTDGWAVPGYQNAYNFLVSDNTFKNVKTCNQYGYVEENNQHFQPNYYFQYLNNNINNDDASVNTWLGPSSVYHDSGNPYFSGSICRFTVNRRFQLSSSSAGTAGFTAGWGVTDLVLEHSTLSSVSQDSSCKYCFTQDVSN